MSYFYYSEIGPLGWRVVRHEKTPVEVDGKTIYSVQERVVLPSLYSDRVAAKIAQEYNIGLRQ